MCACVCVFACIHINYMHVGNSVLLVFATQHVQMYTSMYIFPTQLHTCTCVAELSWQLIASPRQFSDIFSYTHMYIHVYYFTATSQRALNCCSLLETAALCDEMTELSSPPGYSFSNTAYTCVLRCINSQCSTHIQCTCTCILYSLISRPSPFTYIHAYVMKILF